jgi:hypothetical protein
MQEQNFKNHVRFVPLFHFVLFLILTLCLIGSVWNLVKALEYRSGRMIGTTILGLDIAGILTAWFARTFALKAQDRGIRAEENLRYFALTGKLLDKRLHISQIIALRFAEDSEFITLVEKAVNENMKAVDIKKAIVKWRADVHRA